MPRLLVALLLLLAAPAQAGWWGDLVDSIEIEVDGGVMAANLSGGLTSLTASWDDDDAVGQALDSVGRGTGVVLSVEGRVEVLGHDLFFNYLSDDVFDTAAAQAADGRVSGVARDALLFLAGELRPDLGDFLDGDQSWVRLEYGRFEGPITTAWGFGSRNGEPWFGSGGARWETTLLTVEAGLYDAVDEDEDRFGRRERDALGYFARYTQFGRPAVLGFDVDGRSGFALQDAELGMVALGVRAEIDRCGRSGFCAGARGDFIPFTGWTWLDLGPFGTTRGVALAGGFDLHVSYLWRVVGTWEIEPYAAFRADWLFPFTGWSDPASIDVVTLWQPDYLFWGPSLGLKMRL